MSLSIILSMLLGVVIGAIPKLPKSFLRLNEILTMIIIWVLLFTLGISLGIKIDIETFTKLGVQSVSFTLFTGFFSIIVVHLFYRWFVKEK